STADGVPFTPNAPATLKPSSSTTGDLNPCAWLSAAVPTVTTRSLGERFGGLASQAFTSLSICWQKPQPGFQKSRSVGLPRKSASETMLPERDGRLKAGAGSP